MNAYSWEHPTNPFAADPFAVKLRNRYGGTWSLAQKLRVDEPVAIEVSPSGGAAVVVSWDGEEEASGIIASRAVLPLDRVRGQDLAFYINDANQVVELKATSFDPTAFRGLAGTASKEAADQAIKAVQYKRGQLESLNYAKGGSKDYETGALLTFVGVLDKWLNDYAPEWYDAKEYEKIVSTAQGIVANVDAVLGYQDENLFKFADDMRRGAEELVDQSLGKSSELLTLLVVGLVALAVINVVKAIP